MVEHRESIGDLYADGIAGQKVAVAGYSHHTNKEDTDSVTEEVLRQYVFPEHCERIAFFDRIAGYFGNEPPQLFWRRVVFFNFVPDTIGPDRNRYGFATKDQEERGRSRVLRLLDKHKPDKLLVFTRKGWAVFPPTIEEQGGQRCVPLMLGRTDYDWGTYRIQGAVKIAVGLQHPQFALTSMMKEAVRQALELRL